MRMLTAHEQGNLYNRLIYPGWGCESSSNTDKELDLDYFLRGRSYLRRYHGYRVLSEAQPSFWGQRILGQQLLYRLRPVLVRVDSGDV